MAEVRRCRRCKRKRMDDEPPEVKQYKTCAKCRIIERQKKKSRKPLAEETMIYGMKQFQQQSSNSNFSHDDIFMDDELFSKKKYDSNANMNMNSNQYQYQYQYSYPNGNGAAGTNGNIGINGVAGSATMAGSADTNYAPKFCDICNEKLDLNEEISVHYNLCLNCYADPFKLYNAFDDYNEFLKKVGENNSKNVINHIFLKQIDKNFVDNLNSMNKVINVETQFREFILDNLKKIYIEPIIASSGYEFTLISSNVNELSSTSPTVNDSNQYQYKDTKPIKAYFKCLKEINNKISCESNLFLDYSLFNNFLKIKYNHKVHNFFLTYPLRFINILYEIYNGVKESSSDPSKVGFNPYTGEIVLEELTNKLGDYEDEFKTIINAINKEDFINEFHHLGDIFESHKNKLLTKELSEPPKPSDDTSNGGGRHDANEDDDEGKEDNSSKLEDGEEDEGELSGINGNVLDTEQSNDGIDKILDPAFE
ncbi:hypothetical protein CANTEDRAFT_112720 [Yamadazyma tenuis ATCC 10573]|uniref:Uncharacterized protein n=1 Tax=Candida tenuis (strain ATCC 10573 / BCRC 21748 / CBS 615 / JCM 9827 / NBRC 10315 / NRRL Y-1498 / VKM Y-70) TaxID=590646 RepID=G3AYG6_CANTC|nr:uncharacterized protein CANTEDRAFT_112720 [Yamadazyma tenuis ATCC 10573]EGV65848.1 hypothetical protein CANTEDRAFT_112720 [Yamadazyma tenuis ATCC 10573]